MPGTTQRVRISRKNLAGGAETSSPATRCQEGTFLHRCTDNGFMYEYTKNPIWSLPLDGTCQETVMAIDDDPDGKYKAGDYIKVDVRCETNSSDPNAICDPTDTRNDTCNVYSLAAYEQNCGYGTACDSSNKPPALRACSIIEKEALKEETCPYVPTELKCPGLTIGETTEDRAYLCQQKRPVANPTINDFECASFTLEEFNNAKAEGRPPTLDRGCYGDEIEFACLNKSCNNITPESGEEVRGTTYSSDTNTDLALAFTVVAALVIGLSMFLVFRVRCQITGNKSQKTAQYGLLICAIVVIIASLSGVGVAFPRALPGVGAGMCFLCLIFIGMSFISCFSCDDGNIVGTFYRQNIKERLPNMPNLGIKKRFSRFRGSEGNEPLIT